MAKNLHNVHKVATPRIGEGTAIEGKFQTSVGVNGSTVVGMNFDLNSAPVPTRRYAADVASFEVTSTGVKLIFGQRKVAAGFRSVLIVLVPKMSTKLLVSGFEAMTPTLEQMCVQFGVELEPTTKIDEEPPQAIQFVANFFASAVAGEEGCIDCYHASPFAIRAIQETKKLSVEPVVRIDIPVALLATLMRELSLVSRDWPMITGDPNVRI